MPRARILVDDALIEAGDPHAVIEPLWWLASTDSEQAYLASVADFTQEQRWMHAVAWYQAEVCNGGHHQFLFNSTGLLWSEALAGVEALGLDGAAGLLRALAERLGAEPPRDRDAREALLFACREEFEDLDDAFYAEVEGVLEPAMHAFMRAHKAAFHFDGIVDRPDPIDLGDLIQD